MTDQEKNEITKISQEFASGFEPDIPEIKGSGWLIVDPLSAYLNVIGHQNKLYEIPSKGDRPQILVMEFLDGSKFIPSGSDLPVEGSKDWMWL